MMGRSSMRSQLTGNRVKKAVPRKPVAAMAKGGKAKSRVNEAGNYTKPTMRKALFNKIKAGAHPPTHPLPGGFSFSAKPATSATAGSSFSFPSGAVRCGAVWRGRSKQIPQSIA